MSLNPTSRMAALREHSRRLCHVGLMAVALSTTVASAAVQKRAVAKTPRYAIPDASKGWPAIAGPAGNVVICLDPGHPSEVSDGTRGKKITEIHAAWEVALKLRRLLLRDQYRVVMTKSSEMEFVTNRRRADIANHFHAALMLRLHCDDGSKSGFGSYYPDRAVTLQGHHGPPASVLSASRVAAQIIHSSAIDALRGLIGNAGLHTDRETFVGHKQGGLTGSVFSNVPTVLVEMAVLGNKHDDDFISKPEGQEKMAEALERGLLKAVPRQ